MRIVPEAIGRPNQCFVFPQLGANHKDGYVDTGNEINAIDPHAYCSIAAVKEMARLIGWVSGDDHAVIQAQLEAALSRIETLEAEKNEKQQALDAIDFLGSHDFIARRKRGPKPQPERSAA